MPYSLLNTHVPSLSTTLQIHLINIPTKFAHGIESSILKVIMFEGHIVHLDLRGHMFALESL
jgi:hypothetical protein